MQRVRVPELLDYDQGTEQEIRGSLADLRLVNRIFGGVRATTRLLTVVARRHGLERLRCLDVAGSNGDFMLLCQEQMKKAGIALDPVVLDRASTHIRDGVPAVSGDALALPFADDAFDVVTCSLFLHHLDPDQAIAFCREALRVSRLALVVNDLIRSPLHLGLVYLAFPLYRSRLTRHDAPVSVRAAYTVAEARDLVSKVSPSVEVSSHFLYRMGVIAWKTAATI